MSEKKNRDRGRSSSSSSSSSSDEEYKNLPKAERKEKKRQRKLLEKDKKKERKERDRSSSSSSSSSDEDDKNISKKRKQKKKEKKSTERKNKDRKPEKGVKERRAKGKENERPIPVLPATAKKADVKVPSAEESGEAKATQDRGKDEDDSDTDNEKDKISLKKESTENIENIENMESTKSNDALMDNETEHPVGNSQKEISDTNQDNDELKISEQSDGGEKKSKTKDDVLGSNNQNLDYSKEETQDNSDHGENVLTRDEVKEDENENQLNEKSNTPLIEKVEIFEQETSSQDSVAKDEMQEQSTKENDENLSASFNDDAKMNDNQVSKGEIRVDEIDNEKVKDDDDYDTQTHTTGNKPDEGETADTSETEKNKSKGEDSSVVSPSEKSPETTQAVQSPEVQSSPKSKNELVWEKVSQDDVTTSPKKQNDDDDKDDMNSDDYISKKSNDERREKYDEDFESETKSMGSVKIDDDDDQRSYQSKRSAQNEGQQQHSEDQKLSSKNENQKHVVIAPEVITSEKEKEKSNVSNNNKNRQSNNPGPKDSRTPSPRQRTFRQKQEERKFRRPAHSAPVKSQTSLNRPKTTDSRRCFSRASASGRQKKQYKTEELRRLQDVLQKEKSHIRKPRQRPHFPFVWTSLEPYYNTQTAAFLIDLHGDERRPAPVMRSRTISTPEEFRHSYVSRNTAIGLCDPWIDLKMDHEILPKIDSANRTSTRGSQNLDRSREREKKETEQKEKKEKKGSTRLPKFPVVPFHAGKENATMRFPYQDIPKFRQDMEQRFSLHAPKKVENDYKRTKDDFYRMDLDKLEEVHPMNRPHMRKAYFAYLQNTPGSKKAVAECVRSLDDTQPKNTGSPQKAN